MKRRISVLIFLAILFGAADGGADLNMDTSSPFIYPVYSKKISMDFQDAPLVDVLKIFSQQTRLNLITSEALIDRTVTVYLDEVPVEQALEQILRANNLTYELQPNSEIYIVKPLTQPEIELITRVYPLKHATVDSSKLYTTLNITLEEGGAAGAVTAGGSFGILSAIDGILTEEGRVVEDPRTNSLIVTDIASNFPHIEGAIAKLDVPVPQILIEVEMLEVTKETADLIGVKMGSTPLAFTGGQRDHFYPWDQNKIISSNNNRNFVTDFLDAEYRVGTLDATGLSMTLQFLRTQKDTKNLARPRILTLNNEMAQIKISTDEAIGAETSTSTDDLSATTRSVEAERTETGVFLTVTPQANLLTEEIIMAVVPRVIIARTGGTFQGTTFKDPEERGSQSILKVRSGETIIIGGLIREDENNVLSKVPILGDIPVIGPAFRHKDETITQRELVIFITPHILNETETRTVSKYRTPKTAALVREQDVPIYK